ncbi:M10 family metallopeptidase C-terminal domain-containing protein [Acuticoccus sp. M5D2P5]|uniref:calcium-binding protein n=1 Tax=Acuticoccus kalidii TaxID=2910977 RepID=UPI001F24DF98|nr:calcium-binding protein [Acuticoccus kalidii]MCF3932669.1 M10 family metallopeptidase C-terminal domain-containing protein [Acuticoccus kalidii]MCF3934421.1 M10 family metallopeptidase C-terminal domain-containing protein [Acuticoccus kalidii]
MAVKIRLHAEGNQGVNYNQYLDTFLDTFTSTGFPFFEQNDEMVLVSELDGPDTQAIVLEGANFAYDMGSHTVSGRLSSVTLGHLGDSYNNNGSFDLDGQGHITNYTPVVEYQGLRVANGANTRGDFHEIVAELMYLGGTNSRGAETFLDEINGSGHILTGTSGNDTYRGTEFRDIVRGGGGNDRLFGEGGNDKILGGAGRDILFGGDGNDILNGGPGNDILNGGMGADRLVGGPGNDVFVYRSVEESNKAGRDVIFDFAKGDNRINLRAIDADETTNGNQRFDFIGEDRFSGTAGELRSVERGAHTLVMADTNGDGRADFLLTLKNYSDLDAGDFFL